MTMYAGPGADDPVMQEIYMRCLIALVGRLGDEAVISKEDLDYTSYTILRITWDEKDVTLRLRPASRDEIEQTGEQAP